MKRPLRSSALVAGLALVAGTLALGTATTASANPAGTGLVISEAYGGGGNSGATWTNDFVELYNPTSAPISVDGLSIQYRSKDSTSPASGVTPLSGSVPAGGHYLVAQAAGNGGTKPLPSPDATGSIMMSASAFQTWLAQGTTALTPPAGDVVGTPGVIDFLGVNAGSFERVKTPGASNTTSASRNAAGADTDDNLADFAVTATITPESSAVAPGGGDGTPVEATIAEIQGTDAATSPLVGKTVTTRGVVTARYPTGGINGLYLQTEGTGGSTDATPGASDGLFVYGPKLDESAYAIGDLLEVTGPVSEFAGTTEVTPAADGVTQVPGPVTMPTPLATELPATEADREAHEGELLAPRGPFTVTNTYSTNQYAEIGLAAGTTPLVQPTEVEDAQTGDIAGLEAANAARAVTLDDGASINFLPFGGGTNQDVPLPWLTRANPIRVGAPVTFTGPVVLEYRNSTWKFQPTEQVTGTGTDVATFANTRTPAPEPVGGDIRLATFNVLNYFPTTADEFVASGLGSCTYYSDREGNHVTANSCNPNGPRGAADAANLRRQQDKIVHAINALGASIVSLEEIENSVKFGKDRDFALATLVDALNADAGPGTWAFAPSPPAGHLPSPDQEDVIRTAFIYRPADVALVGASEALIDEDNFDNAREPLAQGFKLVGEADTDAFGVIVNHFKSKGSGVNDGTGQGNSNPDRVGQAHALSAFADTFQSDRGIDRMFLVGDFNAYSMEDPMQVLYDDGYTAIDSTTADEETYSFSGLSGSLDHVLANDAALPLVTGADVWNINSGESVAFEYSRFNYNVTSFYEDNVFRSSDHDPEVVGIRDPRATAALDVKATPQSVRAEHDRVKLHISVTSPDGMPTGLVEVKAPGQPVQIVTLEDGEAKVRLDPFAESGVALVRVSYAGDDRLRSRERVVEIVVDPANA